MGFRETYNYLFVELSCPETREWFVSSPFLLLLLILGYVYFIYYAGPRYMKNRPPYKLKTFMLIYNLLQILANIWAIKLHIDMGWFSHITEFSFANCMTNYANYLDATKLLGLAWWLLCVRVCDYIETCIFVLRKKQNQVSVLHVYHHITIIMFGWYFLKFNLF
ncbi:PREDICTED: elongation of very long chain fatty acids protein AAEL008004-like isoform X2 [Vollenhovia emeryi]|uniref:elongation of very long chain fatty acids protein AAEL008004-like isoform X2 n=1 Tax=Vollenhovia emeryi TaxID=411798 RepID=UPI0005F4546F|nr:PREDICTED: elongation of very long chain fatty acids protein AAEL008004-like isoform X2 [Vollenhovia emeryi]